MDITETLYVATRAEWRSWLEEYHDRKSEIWLVGYRKSAGVASVAYSDAVKEALCFGWIDSIRKKLDEDRWAQRYTPRNPRSEYSQTNKERLERLIEEGLVLPNLVEELGDLQLDAFEIPPDIEAALRDGGAWEFFRSTSPSYQRIRVAYVEYARKQPEIFDKRLAHLVKKSAQRKQYGYGIEEFY